MTAFQPHPPRWWRRPPIRLAVTAAWLLTRLPPVRIRAFLLLARRGARPATRAETWRARSEITALSVACAGEGCLQRSVATTLLCRMRGSRPTWCTGVRTQPFAAHAWVEVDPIPVGENTAIGQYHRLLNVPPQPPRTLTTAHPTEEPHNGTRR
ncbi:lasso peptide biosynthesis B2 protein [Streptomyces mexicanus]|uniref:lasso peptide biosynthesis B2 protein n=1 Tax=Streptomyces mexicanus TaxID=178566 RepID=UPI003655C38E